jgi:hypothetical protein
LDEATDCVPRRRPPALLEGIAELDTILLVWQRGVVGLIHTDEVALDEIAAGTIVSDRNAEYEVS